MFRSFIPIALLAAAATQTGKLEAAADQTAAPPAGNARSGRALFVQYGCQQCHGTVGQGGGQFGPKIAPAPIAYSAYYHQLRRPRMMMPIYTPKILNEQQVADIYAYLNAIPPAKDYHTIPALNVK